MKKKMLTLLLTGAMTIGLLSGCGGTNNGENAGDSGSVANSEATTNSESAGNDEKELDVVRILCVDTTNGTTGLTTSQWEEYPASKPFIEALEEIGIRIELDLVPEDGYADAVKARMATGTDLPDLIAYSYWSGCNQADVAKWAEEGLVYALDDLLEQYDEDGSIKAYYEEKIPGLWEMNTLSDGKNYYFPNGSSGGTKYDTNTNTEYVLANTCPGISIRESWVKAVGEEVKEVYSLDELATLMKKMYDEDANGNGVSDEVIYARPDSFSNAIAIAFGLNQLPVAGYYEDEDVVYSNFYHENFPAYIEYMKDLYEYGVLDPIVLSATADEMTSSNVVSVQTTTYAVWSWENSMSGVSEEEGFYQPIMIDTDGNLDNGFSVCIDNNKISNSGAHFIPTTCENPEPVIRFLDYIFTDEYQTLNSYGREGVNYELLENGMMVVDWANTDTSVENSRFVLNFLGLLGLPKIDVQSYATAMDYGDMSTPAQKRDYWLYEKFSKEYYPKADRVTFGQTVYALETAEETAVIEEKYAVLETYCQELLTDLIFGNKSLDDLPTYQAELEELGLQEYIDVMQARRDRITGK